MDTYNPFLEQQDSRNYGRQNEYDDKDFEDDGDIEGSKADVPTMKERLLTQSRRFEGNSRALGLYARERCKEAPVD